MSQTGVTTQIGTDPAALVHAVRAGTITPEQALDRLVERAVGSASSLTPSQQAELRTVLLEALQADPMLRELADALG